MRLILIPLTIFGLTATVLSTTQLRTARENHSLQRSTDENIRYLATLSDPNYFNKALDTILVPRVVGTESHEKVANFIAKELKKLKWHVEIDEFIDKTPIFGDLVFKNIIATLNPKAERFLVFACHYDSKYFENEVFVGAIDSAVPCAMMISLAKMLSSDLDENRKAAVSLKLVFFDGEEAFENWGPTDSIYGAKHLAKRLESNKTNTKGGEISELDKIDALILLDLIGAPNPVFRSYFPDTERWFSRLADIEDELHRARLLKNHRYRYFSRERAFGHIEDDHIPFLQRNVPVLHLITAPFPPEWHTPKDDKSIIDMDTVNNINLILKVFVSEYLHLSLESSAKGLPEKEL